MRILLISSNRHDRFASLPIRPMPLGLAILLGVLRGTRHQVHALDLMFAGSARRAIRKAIRESSPDLIGISVRNLDAMRGHSARSFLPDIRRYVDICRGETGAPVVLGGPAVSLLPREAFAALEPDFILAGDATRTLPELANRIEGGKPIGDLPGLVCRSGGDIRVNPPGPWESPKLSPCYDAFDLSRYEAEGYGIAVLTKTWPYIRVGGTVPVSAMPSPVLRPIPHILDDLRRLEFHYGIRRVFLADSGFNVPVPEAKLLCQAIRDARLNLTWATGLQPGHMDAELADLMRETSCRMALLAGPGPLQEPIGDFEHHLNEFETTGRLLRVAGVPLVTTTVFGRPGETWDTVDQTLGVLSRIRPAHVQLCVGIRLLPFTPLAERAKAEGVIQDHGDCLNPVVYVASELRDWLPGHLKGAARGHSSWHVA
jgi:radical SAM superfamily enzyme YgiQ (UPF0313 family)